ncbi:uncharacterized protein K02A2.6-like [Xenia sp. Carnegie-2017]|uniref:uncharacterized protein K02A2.6-like n=1 Tax=Xenia sp. Carnegie-2017 TaxID=2897299 RepID=UPI001F03FFE4|nr:uncharacterized protein K02A2.6-like [Xenia sp. Carnegie-2017]
MSPFMGESLTIGKASNITNRTRQRALLHYQAGPRIREIFRQFPDPGEDDNFAKAEILLTEYFEPQKNRLYEVYKFRQAKQVESETIDQFHTRLRSLSKNCEFADVDFEIMVQIVIGGRSSRVRKQALRDPKYTLKDLLLEARRDETSKVQAADIEEHLDSHVLHTLKKPTNKNSQADKPQKICFYCGGNYPHLDKPCPAKNKTCAKCGKLNHFASQCRSRNSQKMKTSAKPRQDIRPVKADEEKDSSSDNNSEYCYAVCNNNKPKRPETSISLNGLYVRMTIDTGSSINIIDKKTFRKFRNTELEPTSVKAYPFNSKTPVKMEGKFRVLAESKHKFTVATIYVTSDDGGCLLSSETAQELGLVSINLNKINTSPENSTLTTKDTKLHHILDKHAPVFDGLGKLKNKQIRLAIDDSVLPVAQPQRRTPFHLRLKVESEIHRLENDDIIEKIPEGMPTDWVSPVVIVPKRDGNIRLCVDMRIANTAIKRTRHPIPTVEAASMELNGARIFSKLNLAQAYHQLELCPAFHSITTFSTHYGLYRYKRLNYGTNSAAELFQHKLQETLLGIKGVKNIADDIIVFGSNRADHDRALDEVLTRLQDHNLTLNCQKCKFLKKNLEFFGLLFSEHGVCPDPKKEPLRKLTRKCARFAWTWEHQAAYDKLKNALTNSPVMSHFDTSKETSTPKRNIAEEYITFVTTNAAQNAISIEVIKEHTTKDISLQAVRTAVESGDWSNQSVKPILSIKDEISVDNTNGILLRGTRIIIPTTLKTSVVKLAHEGHQGIAKTKALLRQYAWFPNMDKAVKDEIEACLPCQVNGSTSPPEPLASPEMPECPWQTIHADFYGPLPTGQYIIVLIDKHGIPLKFKSDNGPPFNSKEFSKYLHKLGVKHETSIPEWPQGNSEAEAFMKPLAKAIKTARAEHRNWTQELSRFLLSYRTTPHCSTNVPPAQLLFNRPLRGILPMLNPKDKVLNRHKEAQANNFEAKSKGRELANKRRTKESDIRVGDKVLLKQRKKDKFTTKFVQTPYTVIYRRGAKVVAENHNHQITRNTSFFKKIRDKSRESTDEDEYNIHEQPYRHNQCVPECEEPEHIIEPEPEEPAPRRSTRQRKITEQYGNSINPDFVIL